MRRAKLEAPEQGAVLHFVDAVLALSEDPGPANLERYLTASRKLDDSRKPREDPAQVRAQARGRRRRPTRVEPANADA